MKLDAWAVGITAGSREVPGRNACDRRHTYCIIILCPTKVSHNLKLASTMYESNTLHNKRPSGYIYFCIPITLPMLQLQNISFCPRMFKEKIRNHAKILRTTKVTWGVRCWGPLCGPSLQNLVARNLCTPGAQCKKKRCRSESDIQRPVHPHIFLQ